MKPIKTNNQVEIIVFKKDANEQFLFLMFKRNEQKGGFWQPITGGVHEGESFEQALNRELWEETGISKILNEIDIDYTFEFYDEKNKKQFEKVFAVEIAEDVEIKLSEEHTEMKWANFNEVLELMKWDTNKEALMILWEKLND